MTALATPRVVPDLASSPAPSAPPPILTVADDTLDGGNVLPGFSAKVAELFDV